MEVKPLNILLADDNIDDCLCFKKALAELPLSAHLTIVNDGEELMKYLAVNSERLPDVLFLDLQIPRKNGFECLTEIKGNEKLKRLLVVMYSSSNPKDWNSERNMINMLYKVEALRYFHKPENMEQLKLALHQTLILVKERNRALDNIRILITQPSQYGYSPNGQ